MSWKTQYLSNLMVLIEADDELTNEEFLALRHVEERLRARLEDHMGALHKSKTEGALQSAGISEQKNLFDMLVLAYVDEVYSPEEDSVIQTFIERAEILPHKVMEIRESAKTAAESLIDQIIRIDISTVAEEGQG